MKIRLSDTSWSVSLLLALSPLAACSSESSPSSVNGGATATGGTTTTGGAMSASGGALAQGGNTNGSGGVSGSAGGGTPSSGGTSGAGASSSSGGAGATTSTGGTSAGTSGNASGGVAGSSGKGGSSAMGGASGAVGSGGVSGGGVSGGGVSGGGAGGKGLGGAAGSGAMSGSGGSGGASAFTLTTPAWPAMDGCAPNNKASCAIFPKDTTALNGGKNQSPEFNWTPGPSGTQSYAIVLRDLTNVVNNAPFVHWAIWNIPASATKLPANLPKTATLTEPAGAMQRSLMNNGYYGSGKCGNVYEFTLYALGDASITAPGTNQTQAANAIDMAASKLATATLRARSGAPECSPDNP